MAHEKTNAPKALASISLDLDNQWSYMKTHGDPDWQQMPSYLNTFIPHVLDLLERINTRITFFIVGQDAAVDGNKEVLSQLTRQGHEVGNHSFHHEVWLHGAPKKQIRREILMAEDQIVKATGQKPVGYRGPGFTWSPALLQVLADIGYSYDASTLPTYLGPLARRYYFWTSRLTSEQKKKRAKIYGDLKDGLKAVKPYYWKIDSRNRLLEIPVSTIPIVKSPFHLSYLIYLSRISGLLMKLYLVAALGLCKMTSTQPSFLLHPLDLIGGDQIRDLAFFPGMDLSTSHKVRIFNEVMRILSNHYELVTMSEHAAHVRANGKAQIKRP